MIKQTISFFFSLAQETAECVYLYATHICGGMKFAKVAQKLSVLFQPCPIFLRCFCLSMKKLMISELRQAREHIKKRRKENRAVVSAHMKGGQKM